MAEKIREKAASATKQDPWASGRQRFSLQQFRRKGRKNKWTFSGQQPDEEVRLVVRRHWWFLIQPGAPVIGLALLLVLLLWASTVLPGDTTLWWTINGLPFLCLL